MKVALPSPPPEMRLGAVVVGRVESQKARRSRPCPRARCCSPETSRRSGWSARTTRSQRRKVQLAEFDADSVVVSHGLSAGEKVVTAGVNSLADGELVKPETEVE